MDIVCLDMEGVLVPEIWINVAERTGIEELKITTRDEPDYDKLMAGRIRILEEHNLKLKDIQDVIAQMGPMEGALSFLDSLRSMTQVVILSDTFSEFANPLMRQLNWPTIWCNSLEVDEDNRIIRHRMRLHDGKKKAIQALKALNYRTFAAGDSYNDLTMIQEADGGCLFRAPKNILEQYPHLQIAETYDKFLEIIKEFLD
ncbi:bifunctional phosphoserine phosphatase/homoserine phosphotransferase ThrH [uncultured Sphaerochaeta sp.]|uniref:bifunctional phosphoserine phosphatase/homoserine phosphotransferase ThrH n=1 Tax=uncultured Sphaerochaeta sp. TaxID=886478 RepID=UPI002A0A476C|nr:bifunctional phosphoserine phosphatase/homoserine phosphotransferase ThrH [uncultured Sphaerochaeta sp.]MCK9349286.1 bifunctional phosphoserine phosphatase/homoserine phosphotransferase ThrH [Sphaerochaeta sp.]MDY0244047.1 bifunctional phosphoserine phosphatase/homoserine phosphotransferase ThrH [Sphaerochaeta sp.]